MACFAIRASVRGDFDVLVRSDAKNQLPTMQLPIDTLDAWHLNYLQQLDGSSVSNCLKFFKAKLLSPNLANREQIFASQLHDTLEALREEINDPFFQEAMLIAKPVSAPCRGLSEDSQPGTSQLIAFRIIVPIHSRAPGARLEFTPLAFFKMQQHVYKNSPNHAVFARKIHREFGPILNQTRLNISPGDKGYLAPKMQRRSRFGGSTHTSELRDDLEHGPPTLVPGPRSVELKNSLKFWNRDRNGGPQVTKPNSAKTSDTSSEKNLVEQQSFGGIMVSQEVSVDVRDIGSTVMDRKGSAASPSSDEVMEMEMTDLGLGTRGQATKEVEDPPTYVDRLFAVCAESR